MMASVCRGCEVGSTKALATFLSLKLMADGISSTLAVEKVACNYGQVLAVSE